MIKYTLPSGNASIKMTSMSWLAEKEFTYPNKRKDLEKAFQEALEELARITNES